MQRGGEGRVMYKERNERRTKRKEKKQKQTVNNGINRGKRNLRGAVELKGF